MDDFADIRVVVSRITGQTVNLMPKHELEALDKKWFGRRPKLEPVPMTESTSGTVMLDCPCCGRQFRVGRGKYNERIRRNKHATLYCSRECLYTTKRKERCA